ncbi:MAG: acyl-CoA thioesterase [Bacteroidia bacterium]
MTKHPLQIKLRIDWSELDLFGHVNNVMFYKYIQSARVKFWEQIGLYGMYEKEGIAPLLASASIDFKKPLLYPGNTIIKYAPVFIKNTSFGLEYSIQDDNSEIAALGKDTMVLYDFNKNRKLTIPDNLRMNIEKLK